MLEISRLNAVFKWAFLCAFLCAISSFFGDSVQGSEQIGELKVSDFFAEPTFTTDSPGGGTTGFSIGRSYLGVQWTQDNVISAKVLVGPKSLLVIPSREGPDDKSLGIVEGYGQADTAYGLFKMGMIPVLFGYEGAISEGESAFTNSLMYQQRLVLKRDLGASYSMRLGDAESFMAVHNGEAGPDQDSRLWMTARFSLHGAASSQVGVSGQTGRWVDPVTGREEKIRTGNVFAGFRIYDLGLNGEATMSSSFYQDTLDRQWLAWHADLLWPLLGEWGFQARYDFIEPDYSVGNDQRREVTAGVNWHSHYRTSTLYFLGSSQWQEGVSVPQNWVRVIWQITPLAKNN